MPFCHRTGATTQVVERSDSKLLHQRFAESGKHIGLLAHDDGQLALSILNRCITVAQERIRPCQRLSFDVQVDVGQSLQTFVSGKLNPVRTATLVAKWWSVVENYYEERRGVGVESKMGDGPPSSK